MQRCRSLPSVALRSFLNGTQVSQNTTRYELLLRACFVGDQTVDHLIYHSEKLENERGKLIAHISRGDDWPVQKSVLVNKYLQQFSQFANSIDFEKL